MAHDSGETVAKNITILYEDESILALDKPSGLVVHPDGRTDEYTLTDWLRTKYPDIENVGEPLVLSNGEVIDRPGIVHRLDRDTSGVMLVAKTQNAFLHLKEQFQERTVEKTYNSFVYGTPKEDEGTIDRPIGKSAKDFRLWSAQRGAKGKLRDAQTDYTVLASNEDASYLEVRPKTGRTHQIRVHMKAVHHPVVCDPLYAPNHACILGFSRLALHARSISFDDMQGVRQNVEAAFPDDFTHAHAVLEEKEGSL